MQSSHHCTQQLEPNFFFSPRIMNTSSALERKDHQDTVALRTLWRVHAHSTWSWQFSKCAHRDMMVQTIAHEMWFQHYCLYQSHRKPVGDYNGTNFQKRTHTMAYEWSDERRCCSVLSASAMTACSFVQSGCLLKIIQWCQSESTCWLSFSVRRALWQAPWHLVTATLLALVAQLEACCPAELRVEGTIPSRGCQQCCGA